MSTSGTGAVFSGTSRYSSDFQQIIDRSVAIASLPQQQMQSELTTMTDESTELSAMNTKFQSLQSAMTSLGSALAAFGSSTSDGTVASATVSTGAMAGTYNVEVVDIGSYGSAMSKAGLPTVSAPGSTSISSSSTFTLTVGGTEYSITPEANSLTSLADAINASDAPVEATVVNIGSTSSPDYRLSVRNTKLGAVGVQLSAGSTDLMDTVAPGTPATYLVNGQPADPIESDSRTVAISPGLSVTLLKAGSTSISVSHNTSSVGAALSSIASAYNAAVDEIDKNTGKDAGALRGSSLLTTLSASLREIAGYSSGTDGISSLASLGLVLDDTGKMSLDSSAFSDATSGKFDALSAFLGSASTDGFLAKATDVLNGLEDPSSGAITTAIDGLKASTDSQNERIAAEQDRIDQLQQYLTAQLSAADAAIAALEQQVTYMTGLFTAMRTNSANQ
jgi:flagellar hook-associated protein 2